MIPSQLTSQVHTYLSLSLNNLRVCVCHWGRTREEEDFKTFVFDSSDEQERHLQCSVNFKAWGKCCEVKILVSFISISSLYSSTLRKPECSPKPTSNQHRVSLFLTFCLCRRFGFSAAVPPWWLVRISGHLLVRQVDIEYKKNQHWNSHSFSHVLS